MATQRSNVYGTAVAVARIGMGVFGLLAPRRTQTASLLGGDVQPSVKIWTRFWATRAIGLGIGYLSADAAGRRHLVRVGLLVDALDTTFLVAMAARSTHPRRALLWLAALTSTAVAGDLAEMRKDGDAELTSTPQRSVRSVRG